MKDNKRLNASFGAAAAVHLTVILLASTLPQGLSRGVSPVGTMFGVDMIDVDSLAQMEVADHYSLEGKPGPTTSGHAGSTGSATKPGGAKTLVPAQSNKPITATKPVATKQSVQNKVAATGKPVSIKPATSSGPSKPAITKPVATQGTRIITANGGASSTRPVIGGTAVAVTGSQRPDSPPSKPATPPDAQPAGISGNGNPKGEGGGKGTGNSMGVGDGNGYGVGSGDGSGTGYGKESGGPPPPPSFGDGKEALIKMPLPRFPKENPDDNGTVTLLARVDAHGKATEATVVRSSSIASMDRAAKLTVERLWAYTAKGFPYEVEVEVRFAHDDTKASALGSASVHVEIGKWRRVATANP